MVPGVLDFGRIDPWWNIFGWKIIFYPWEITGWKHWSLGESLRKLQFWSLNFEGLAENTPDGLKWENYIKNPCGIIMWQVLSLEGVLKVNKSNP